MTLELTATAALPSAATPTPACRYCTLPVEPCRLQAAGYVTRCRGWVHSPPPGREYGRHSCGTGTWGTQTAAEPEPANPVGGQREDGSYGEDR